MKNINSKKENVLNDIKSFLKDYKEMKIPSCICNDIAKQISEKIFTKIEDNENIFILKDVDKIILCLKVDDLQWTNQVICEYMIRNHDYYTPDGIKLYLKNKGVKFEQYSYWMVDIKEVI
jgi:hypothetical protein